MYKNGFIEQEVYANNVSEFENMQYSDYPYVGQRKRLSLRVIYLFIIFYHRLNINIKPGRQTLWLWKLRHATDW